MSDLGKVKTAQERHETNSKQTKISITRRPARRSSHEGVATLQLQPRTLRTSLRYFKLSCNTLAHPQLSCTIIRLKSYNQCTYTRVPYLLLTEKELKAASSSRAGPHQRSSTSQLVASPSRSKFQPARRVRIAKCSSPRER